MRPLLRLLKEGSTRLGPYHFSWKICRSCSPSVKPLTANGPYKLHLGPGPQWTKPGAEWLTVDIDPERGDLVVDFNQQQKFPLADESVSRIYGSHVFEHMSIYATPTVFRECHRVLIPGGVFRLVLPDAKRSIEEYMAGNTDFPLFARRRERAAENWNTPNYTLFECLREDFLSKSGQSHLLGENALAHQNAWDFDTITQDLVRAGFDRDKIRRMDFRGSQVTEFDFEGTYPSEANEQDRSLYVEAVK